MSKRKWREQNKQDRRQAERAHQAERGEIIEAQAAGADDAVLPVAPVVIQAPAEAITRAAMEQVEETVRRAEVESRQPRLNKLNALTFTQSVLRWIAVPPEPKKASPREYDTWLREFALGEMHLVSVLNSVVQIDKNRGWTLTGGRNQVARYTQVLNAANWREYVTWLAQAYYTTRMGFVSEIGRDGEDGPMRALWAVDPARCELTKDIQYPLKYFPHTGEMQQWKASYYFRATSLISTDEKKVGYGFPAVERCIEAARIMTGVYMHLKETTLATEPRGVLAGKNVTQTDWDKSLESYDERLEMYEKRMAKLLTMMSGGDQMPEFALTLFSRLPEGFDLEKWTSTLMYLYALAFGYDPREFYPVSAGSLGTATESQVQHRKATSKGELDFSLALQEKIQGELPPSLSFQFQQRDDEGKQLDAATQLKQAQVISEISKWVLVDANGQRSVMRPDQILQLAAEKGIIPQEWTATEEDVSVSDTDQTELERALDDPCVRRAAELYPSEPIVQYSYPLNRTRLLFRSGAEALMRRSFPILHPRDVYLPAMVFRSMRDVVNEYERQLNQFVGAVLANEMTATDMARAHRAMIRALATDVYAEGLKSGGVEPEDMDDADREQIDGWIASQLPYVRDFADAVVAARGDSAAQKQIETRIGLWVEALRSLGQIAKASADANAMGTWHFDPNKEHCESKDGRISCATLNGQRHRVKWYIRKGYIPREPGSDTLGCGGWDCGCEVKSDDGKRLL